MKANEIQIGDWLYYKGQFNAFPFEVESITKKKVGYHAEPNEHRMYYLRLSECKPILITPDILEKNGFEKTQIHGEKKDDIFQCFDGEIIIEIGTYDPNFILIRYRHETPDGIESGELSSIVKVDGEKFYLHELQHALRLCGITREIIL